MNFEDMRIRITPMHKDVLCRMLGINELPEKLLKRYFGIKKLLDKVDGALSTSDLVRMALDCGFNVDTMLFEDEKPIFITEDEKPIFITEDEVADSPQPTKEVNDVPIAEESEPETVVDYDLDDALEPVKKNEDGFGGDNEEPAEKKEVMTVGQAVSVFYDGEIVRDRKSVV